MGQRRRGGGAKGEGGGCSKRLHHKRKSSFFKGQFRLQSWPMLPCRTEEEGVLQRDAVCCSMLQCVPLSRTEEECGGYDDIKMHFKCVPITNAAPVDLRHCNTLQHTATRYYTLQHTAAGGLQT